MKSVPAVRAALALAATGALTLTLAACGSSSPGPSSASTSSTNPGATTSAAAQKYADGKTFTMVLGDDPGSLDPDFTSLGSTVQVDRFLYDSLINIDQDGQEQAGLAATWTGDASKVTYTLRQGITCSDGSPLTASDVAKNITFVGDPANKSPRIGVYVPPGAKAVGDDAAGTVTVTVAAPDAFLARNVGGLPIVCAKGMADRGTLKSGADGTGPYTLTEAVPDDHYTLTRRDGYTWGPSAQGTDYDADVTGRPAKVVIKVVGNETTAANLLLAGQVNEATVIGPDRQRLEAKKLFVRQYVQPLGELWFNQKPGLPTADEAVRKALVQGVDLKELLAVTTSGTGKAPTSLVTDGPCDADTVSGNLPAQDVQAAKSVLAGQDIKITLYYPSSLGAGLQAGAELLNKDWSALGVKVTLKAMTQAQAGSVIVGGQGEWTATILPIGVSLPTQIVSFLSGPTPPNGTNFAFLKNSAYEAAVKQASAQSGAAGCENWTAAQKALLQQLDVIPFADSTVPLFGNGAAFEISQGSVTPTSIRMLAD